MNSTHYNPDAVKAARVAAGYKNRTQVATLLGVHLKTVDRTETGIRTSYSLLAKMAELYDVDVKQFLHPTKKICENYPHSVSKVLT